MKLKTNSIRTPLLELSSRSRADSRPPWTALCYLNCKAILFLHAVTCVIYHSFFSFSKNGNKGLADNRCFSFRNWFLPTAGLKNKYAMLYVKTMLKVKITKLALPSFNDCATLILFECIFFWIQICLCALPVCQLMFFLITGGVEKKLQEIGKTGKLIWTSPCRQLEHAGITTSLPFRTGKVSRKG